ncbi:MAG: HAD-IB family phosphatase [Candidatus Aenigmarchaeota archaeon]|nr:HAD-IB family phosphatase [Candidatus Aenigmarchaeota archaeon]
MPKYPLAAFSGGTLVNLLGESNFWDYVRKKWQIPDLHEKYMKGEISREELFGEYKFWQQRGLTKEVLEKAVREDLKLNEGAKEVFEELKKAGVTTAIISGSADILVKELRRLLNPKYVSYNEIVFDNKGLPFSTKPTHPTADIRMDKIAALRDFAERERRGMKECAVVVHQEEDRALCAVAGFSIAFNSLDEEITEAVDEVVKSDNMKDLLEFLL